MNTGENQSPKGVLYIVSTPIGNSDDLTERAKIVLKHADLVVCESIKETSKLLKHIGATKPLFVLDEQNEQEAAGEVLALLEEGKKVALVSDCGTPVFADPGAVLVRLAIKRQDKIDVQVVPGVSSLMAALSRSGFSLKSFLYAGFLNRVPEIRRMELEKLSKVASTIAVFETPYRIMPFLIDCKEIMPDRRAYIACNLTMPFETHHYGSLSQLHDKFETLGFKGEFVVVIEGTEAFAEYDIPVFRMKDGEKPTFKRERSDNRSGGGRFGRDDRRGGDRGGERRSYGDRPERGGGDRGGERRSYGDRPERGGGDRGGERRSYGDRPERSGGERREWRDRDEKGGKPDRRRGFGDKSRKFSDDKRGGKPRFGKDDKNHKPRRDS